MYPGGPDSPGRKDDLVETARTQGADDNVVNTLRSLPRDNFDSPDDVSEAIGEL